MRSFFSVLVLLCSAPAGAKTLSVAVAANMMPVMEEIGREFYAETGVDLALTQGASGKFATQIRNGAPFDVFISADTEFPDALVEAEFTDGPTAKYARGALVLWTMRGADVSSLQALTDSKIKKIAIADPTLAPYGRAAVEALKKAGVYDAVEKKLVYGESLSQVNQFVTSKAADAGFASRSIVETPKWKGKGIWTAVDPSLHAPIDQGLVVTKHGAQANPRLSKKLKELILGPKGRTILEKYGYSVPSAN